MIPIIRKCKYCNNPPEVKKITIKSIVYRNVCSQHKGIKKYKKDSCELCGFKPTMSCQLDLHHRDGNSQNNIESNYATVCANCHRLLTYNEKHYKRKGIVL